MSAIDEFDAPVDDRGDEERPAKQEQRHCRRRIGRSRSAAATEARRLRQERYAAGHTGPTGPGPSLAPCRCNGCRVIVTVQDRLGHLGRCERPPLGADGAPQLLELDAMFAPRARAA